MLYVINTCLCFCVSMFLRLLCFLFPCVFWVFLGFSVFLRLFSVFYVSSVCSVFPEFSVFFCVFQCSLCFYVFFCMIVFSMFVFLYVRVFVCSCFCTFVFLYDCVLCVCVFVCLYFCMFMFFYVYVFVCSCFCVFICSYVRVFVCLNVLVCVVHIFIYVLTEVKRMIDVFFPSVVHISFKTKTCLKKCIAIPVMITTGLILS